MKFDDRSLDLGVAKEKIVESSEMRRRIFYIFHPTNKTHWLADWLAGKQANGRKKKYDEKLVTTIVEDEKEL